MWNRNFNLPSLLLGLSLGILLEFGFDKARESTLPEILPLPKTYRSDGYQRIGHSNLVFIPLEDTLEIVKFNENLVGLRILSKEELHRELERLKNQGLIDIEPVF